MVEQVVLELAVLLIQVPVVLEPQIRDMAEALDILLVESAAAVEELEQLVRLLRLVMVVMVAQV
jgi:hypothetical protein|tara:strand:+ start:454 stop:645 length:192 start_codon:yes stop_codon:yes gene_type:complete